MADYGKPTIIRSMKSRHTSSDLLAPKVTRELGSADMRTLLRAACTIQAAQTNRFAVHDQLVRQVATLTTAPVVHVRVQCNGEGMKSAGGAAHCGLRAMGAREAMEQYLAQLAPVDPALKGLAWA